MLSAKVVWKQTRKIVDVVIVISLEKMESDMGGIDLSHLEASVNSYI